MSAMSATKMMAGWGPCSPPARRHRGCGPCPSSSQEPSDPRAFRPRVWAGPWVRRTWCRSSKVSRTEDLLSSQQPVRMSVMHRRGRGEVQQEVDEEPRAVPGGSFGTPGEVPSGAGGPGHVDVGPGKAIDEQLEEQGGGDGARVVATDVADVGHRGVELVAQAVIEGELPDGLVGPLARGTHLVDESLVVAHDAGAEPSQRALTGAGEG